MEPSDPKWWSSLQAPGQLIQELFTLMLSKALHLVPLFSVCYGLGCFHPPQEGNPPAQHEKMAETSPWAHVSLLLHEQLSICHWRSSPTTMIISMAKFWILASEVPKYCRKRRKIPNLTKNRTKSLTQRHVVQWKYCIFFSLDHATTLAVGGNFCG